MQVCIYTFRNSKDPDLLSRQICTSFPKLKTYLKNVEQKGKDTMIMIMIILGIHEIQITVNIHLYNPDMNVEKVYIMTEDYKIINEVF